MGLKHELQSLTDDTVESVNASLQQRLDSVSRQDLVSETLTHVTEYPALNRLVELVLTQGLADGLPVEDAVQRSVGASHALLTLTTIAELRELPPI